MRWNPVSPVFTKELRQMANGRNPFLIRCIFLGVVGVTLMIALGECANQLRAVEQPKLAANLFRDLVRIQGLMVIVLMPLVTAGMVAGEREANTLRLLFLTRLSNWQIVQDKALARVVQMLWLCLLTLPLYFAVLLIGGIDVGQVLGAGGLLVGATLASAGTGLYCSAKTRSRVGAALLAYLLSAPIALVLPGLAGVLAHSRRGGLTSWLTFAVWPVVLGLGVYLLSVGIAARHIHWERREMPPMTPRKPAPDVLHQLVGLDWARYVTPARPGRQPLVWHILRRRHAGLQQLVLRLANVALLSLAGIALISLVYMILNRGYIGSGDRRALMQVLVFLSLPVAGVCLVILGAESIAGERTGGTWPLLLTMPLSGPRLGGGLLAGAGATGLTIVAMAVAVAVGCFGTEMPTAAILQLLALEVILGVFFLAMSMYVAIRVPSPTTALAMSVALFLWVVFGPALLVFLVAPLKLTVVARFCRMLDVTVLFGFLTRGHADNHLLSPWTLPVYAAGAVFFCWRLTVAFDRTVERQGGGE